MSKNEYMRNYMKEYRFKNPDYNKRHNEQRRKKRLENKIILMNYFSDGKLCCICCGITGIEFLTLDHPNGGGCKERSGINKKAGVDYYAWLIKVGYKERKLEVMCYNCNCAKRDTGICPHKSKLNP